MGRVNDDGEAGAQVRVTEEADLLRHFVVVNREGAFVQTITKNHTLGFYHFRYRLVVAMFASRRSLSSGNASKTSRAWRTLLKGAETCTP